MSGDLEMDFGGLTLNEQGEALRFKRIPAAMKAMEYVRAEVARQTPVETGNLVGSESVRPTNDGAEIVIPGPYARRQHYELSYHHNTGNALFLEIPMVTLADEALAIVAAEVSWID